MNLTHGLTTEPPSKWLIIIFMIFLIGLILLLGILLAESLVALCTLDLWLLRVGLLNITQLIVIGMPHFV